MEEAKPIPFDEWEHQRVALKDVNIHLRYAGRGPPLLLVHGVPKFSLTWHTIGPILAQTFTVIAVDTRGAAQSTIPRDNDYSASTCAEDLKGVLDFLNITEVYAFSHDKGVAATAALALKYPSLVKAVGFSEYALPGFGYEQFWNPSSSPNGWDLNANWQLAFFSVPEAAQFFFQGREREMLIWFFYHASYAGNSSISQDHLDRYTRELTKPGFLRSSFEYYSGTNTIAKDNAFFTEAIRDRPLAQPVIVLGGEASIAPVSVLESLFGKIGRDITYDIIPKAGHWIGDENPQWTADRLVKFFTEQENTPISVDLSYLKDVVSLV
ncbi:hypothetical protein V490_07263 [Pseudogymnoascus sp. VKM F-3557]|nr:hypothetical protein V490_07263 [Pseudogymnoascus sp. VKM F-3557]